ncbi:MAG: hypothetical protein JHC95_23570, partial [Solirubrobacteraceae bacterium]|nr:hypothetical protein [Solirubrobacteraceae bacterium]
EAMRFVRGHPLLRRVAETDPGAVIAAAAGDDRVILTMGTQFIAAQLREASPEGSERAIQRTADLVARLFLSYIALPPDDPDPRDEAELHAYARDVLVPLMALGVEGP